mgnify:CR=1 FL=1
MLYVVCVVMWCILFFHSNLVFRLFKKIVSKIKGNALILVEKIAQGEILEQVLSEVEGREVYFIQGKTKIDERERIKQLMEKNDNIICNICDAVPRLR